MLTITTMDYQDDACTHKLHVIKKPLKISSKIFTAPIGSRVYKPPNSGTGTST